METAPYASWQSLLVKQNDPTAQAPAEITQTRPTRDEISGFMASDQTFTIAVNYGTATILNFTFGPHHSVTS